MKIKWEYYGSLNWRTICKQEIKEFPKNTCKLKPCCCTEKLSSCCRHLDPNRSKAFTLLELIVVISIISTLLAILLPVINSSKQTAKIVLCSNNLRQLTLANQSYAKENDNYAVPASSDIYTENLKRWYASRPDRNSPFDFYTGPLAEYLDNTQPVCPMQKNVKYNLLPPTHIDYEQGSGGYGYNLVYIGSEVWKLGYNGNGCEKTTKITKIKKPSATLVFADTAMVKIIDGKEAMIMYSFAEPPLFAIDTDSQSSWLPFPSIHFRHSRRACIAWADGSANTKKMAKNKNLNLDGTNPNPYYIGWFYPNDNSLFDLK
jgi:prepilin-type N-terminal cleavage/methylation domain-containing protein